MWRKSAFALLLIASALITTLGVTSASATPPKKTPHYALNITAVNNGDGSYTLTVTGNSDYTVDGTNGIWPDGHVTFYCGGPAGGRCLTSSAWKGTGTVQPPPIIQITEQCGITGNEDSAQAFDDTNVGVKSNKVKIPC